MPSMTATHPGLTHAEYVALEEAATVKHELVDGVMVAMSGGSPQHAALASSFARLLGNALEGRPCRVFSSDLRVHVVATGLVAYPDLSVVCGPLQVDDDDPHAIVNPVLLVEVLSPSTEAWDRGTKAAHYRRIEPLSEYVLVSQDHRRVEVVRRTAVGTWELREFGPGQVVVLASVGAELELDALYHDPLQGD